MKDGSFHCDCEVGYGGETCQLTPCSTCAAWDLIGPTGDNHETYTQRNSYCDEIGWDFMTRIIISKRPLSCDVILNQLIRMTLHVIMVVHVKIVSIISLYARSTLYVTNGNIFANVHFYKRTFTAHS